jgi:hypothetical protein
MFLIYIPDSDLTVCQPTPNELAEIRALADALAPARPVIQRLWGGAPHGVHAESLPYIMSFIDDVQALARYSSAN